MGKHVLQKNLPNWKTFLAEVQILLEDMPYRNTYLAGGMSKEKTCLTEGYFSGLYINIMWRMCLTRGHVLWDHMFYWRTCFTG